MVACDAQGCSDVAEDCVTHCLEKPTPVSKSGACFGGGKQREEILWGRDGAGIAASGGDEDNNSLSTKGQF